MAFLPLIPQSTDIPSQSQAQILNNFTVLGAIAGNTNPSSASINATSGFNWIYLPPQGATPPVGSAFTAGNIGIYSANNATSTQNELYVNKRNQATTVQIPMTASTLSVTSAPAANASLWSYLPSGLLMKSGSATGALSGAVTITPSQGPAFTQIVAVLVSPFNGTSAGDLNFAVRLIDINTATTFRIYISSRTASGAASGQTGYQYLAIGY